MRRIIGFNALFLSLASPAVAQSSPAAVKAPPPLSWLQGHWDGTGINFGQPATATLAITPVLDGKYLELDYRVKTSGARQFKFEGRAFYKAAEQDRWQAIWFDSRGMSFPISASATQTALKADWGAEGRERGRTEYVMQPDGTLEVVDSVAAPDGQWREFARIRYNRKP